jgi:hypothetical protein
MLLRPAASVIVLAAAVLAAPTPVLAAEHAGQACAVTGGSLTWGFKESFRSYISGTIAKGAWEPVDGASYETPVFSWPATGGSVDPATGAGSVTFGGGVRFSGHGGLLDTTIAEPTLVLDPAGSRILLDVRGVSMDDALAGATDQVNSAEQVDFVALDPAAVPASDGAALSASDVATTLTADGAAQFGSYEAGTAFDPVSFDVQLACAEADPAAAATPEPGATAVAEQAGDDDTAWRWGIGAGLALIAATLAAFAVTRWRRSRKDAA